MPKVTIDGREIEVAAGTTVLQAAMSEGAEIPHYCYHPGLSVAGNCRMCLVEVEKAPKLLISCATPVADGMVVHTNSDKVKTAQAAVQEFLLVNHPLDCTICDQAGECRLQEYAVEYGRGATRSNDPKVLFNKAVDIGEHVMLDQERCIQCSRCTRFCDEVTGTGELAFFRRGERTMIGIYPGKRLDNPYSGNTVDICPVGALTLKEFRFQTRVWYLKNTPSICAGCARGCNVIVATGRQQEMMTTPGQFDDRIKRIVPRVNMDVNAHWMCDEGRLSWKRLDGARRPLGAESPAGSVIEWSDAVAEAGEAVKAAAAAGRLGLIVGPRATCETLFAWRRVAELDGDRPARVGLRRLVRGADDELLIRADKGPNSEGARRLLPNAVDADVVLDAARRGDLDVLVVLGDTLDPADTVAVDPESRSKLRQLIHVGPFVDAAAEQATMLLPCAAWGEEDGSYVNFEGRVQWLRRAHRPRGEGRPGWRVALDVAAAAGGETPAWATTEDVFDAIAAAEDRFAGMTAAGLGLLGATCAVETAAGA